MLSTRARTRDHLLNSIAVEFVSHVRTSAGSLVVRCHFLVTLADGLRTYPLSRHTSAMKRQFLIIIITDRHAPMHAYSSGQLISIRHRNIFSSTSVLKLRARSSVTQPHGMSFEFCTHHATSINFAETRNDLIRYAVPRSISFVIVIYFYIGCVWHKVI